MKNFALLTRLDYRVVYIPLFFCLLLFGENLAMAEAKTKTSFVLTQVVIPDRENPESDRTVNIIVRDGLVDMVTQDGLPQDQSVPQFDASGGVLLGSLAIGSPAGFLVLNGDPREQIELLLDTRESASFAVVGGEILRNRLPRIPVTETRQKGWIAYTPPPVALYTDYSTRQKWNFYNGPLVTNLFSATVAMDRTFWTDQDSASQLQVGDLGAAEGGSIRAFRFGVVGRINAFDRPLSYTLFGATTAFDKGFDSDSDDSFVWFDYRLDVPLGSTTLSLGKQKEPINMERTMSLLYLPFQERSAPADTFLRSRNVGLVLSGHLFDDRATWAVGAFNDWLEDDGERDDNDSQYSLRLTGIPWQTEDSSQLLHVGLGYRTGSADEGLRTSARPEVNSGPRFIESGLIEADRLETVNYELSWRRGPWWVHSEYIDTRVSGTPFGDLDFAGYHISASWILTGEMRDYNSNNGTFRNIRVARPVNHNGWGAIETGVRFSHTDLSDKGVEGGEMDVWTLGLNWWLRQDMMASLNWRFVELDRPAPESPLSITGEASGLTTRIVMILD